MPKFLEDKLKREYGENSAVPFKVMNKLGAMRGNKETEKGREMERKHEADMKKPAMTVKPKMSAAPMREMRIEIHRGPKKEVTGFTVHHHMMPKATKSAAFSENTTHEFPFDHKGNSEAHGHISDHIDKHLMGQTDAGAVTPKEAPGGANQMEEEAGEGE
jgi:hypothetical protein